MQKTFRSPIAWLASLLLLPIVGYSGNAHAQQQAGACTTTSSSGTTVCVVPQCPDPTISGNPPLGAQCTKEIRVINNTGGPIYAAIQGLIANDTDPWLAAALGGTQANYRTVTYYRAYINPIVGPLGPQTQPAGIPSGGVASISVPWWSKLNTAPCVTPPGGSQTCANTQYFDWWRAGRLYVFDDLTAFNTLYGKDSGGTPIVFAANSPKVTCSTSSTLPNNKCFSAESWTVVQDFDASKAPSQLTEYTLASVPTNGSTLADLNQNYNISDVDQVYLPVAMEAIGGTPQQGWVGTILDVGTFRGKLNAFVGGATAPNWPIQTWPQFPNAGITVPGANPVFVNPARFTGTPDPLHTTYIGSMVKQWTNCIGPNPTNCPAANSYTDIDKAFRNNYNFYAGNPATGQNAACPTPLYPNPPGVSSTSSLYLSKVYGWVPFNEQAPKTAACPPPTRSAELPCSTPPVAGSNCVVPNSSVPGEYIELQDNWKTSNGTIVTCDFTQPGINCPIFNFYAQLIHSDAYLAANSAYAYSIDDQAAFYSDPGTGLAFAVGGSNNLPNTNPRPPAPNPSNTIYMPLGNKAGVSGYTSYQICGSTTTPLNKGDVLISIPATLVTPSKQCAVTLQAANGTDTITIIKPIPWDNTTSVYTCSSTVTNWCTNTNANVGTNPQGVKSYNISLPTATP
jgi:hypothetical protein